jgi:two-component system CheB/CheR fusion protein
MGLVVVDRAYQVTSWNRRSENSWGLREEEALGKELFTLDMGLPADALRQPLQRLMRGETPQETVEVDATNRRGRPTRCHIQMLPLTEVEGGVAGAVIMVDDPTERS